MKITNEKTFCFIHIPKCAGTSITNVLRENFNCIEYRDRKWVPNGGLKEMSHMTMEELEQFYPERLELCRKLFSFCCIRNPYDRFMSAFKYEVSHKTWNILKNDGDELRRYFDSVVHHQSQKNRYFPKHVWATPQYKYIFLRNEKIVDRVYDVTEGLDSIQIGDKILSIPRYNKSNSCIFELSDELKKDIKEFYRRDFELNVKELSGG